MALQMFQVQIGLVAVRTFVLALCVLIGVSDGLADSGCRASGMGGQHPATALLAYDVQWLWLLILKYRRVGIHLGVRSETKASCTHILQSV
jgi:hypothetical protein